MKLFKLKRPLPLNDVKKASQIKGALTVVSAKERQAQLTPPPATKIKLRFKGNRGKNMQENPPSSEEMRRRRAMRKLYNKTMPTLHCSGCQFSAQCPQFRAGFECAFTPFLNAHDIKDEQDLLFYAKELCTEGVKRAQTMLLMERLSGSKPDVDTSEALAHVFNQLMLLHQRLSDQDTVEAEIESSDNTIIGKLFGGLDNVLGKTREVRSNPSVSLSHPGELLLDAPKPEISSAPTKEANLDLIRDLAVYTDKHRPTPAVDNQPIQETL